jgi:hypothetical protein
LNSCADLVDYGDGIFFIFGGTSAQNVSDWRAVTSKRFRSWLDLFFRLKREKRSVTL